MIVDWLIFKDFVTSRSLSIQWIDDGQTYFMKAFDSYFSLECNLNKSNLNDYLTDFENNFKANGNKQIIISTTSVSQPPFGAKILSDGSKLFRRVRSTSGEVTNTPTNIDFTVPFARCKVTGLQILNGAIGDKATFQVLDTANGTISGYPNVVLNTFGTDVYIVPNIAEYPSKYDADLIGGMKLRLVYTAAIQTPKNIYVNFDLHEVVAP
jgi:hypothetical protein